METRHIEAGHDVILVPISGTVSVGTLLPTVPMGMTATALVSYAPQVPAPSGMVSIRAAGGTLSPTLEVKELGGEPWKSTFVVQPGAALYAEAMPDREVRLSVEWMLQTNVGAWTCRGCGAINTGGRLECPTCETRKPPDP